MEGQDATGPVGNGGSGEAAVVAGVPAADPAAQIRAVLPPGALNSPPAMLPDDDLDEDPTGNLDGLVGGADVGGGVVASLGGAMDGPEAEAEEDGAEGPPPGASALPPRGLSVQEIDNIHKLAANFRSLGLDPESLAHAPYRRVLLSGESSLPPTGEAAAAAAMLRGAIGLREKWLYRREVEEWDTPARPAPPRPSPYTTFVPPPYDPFDEPLPAASSAVCHWEDGVLVVYASPAALMRRTPIYPHRRWREFADDLRTLMSVVVAPAARSFCHLRLKLLAERFAMHATLNERQERLEQAAVPHRDFYNVRKVDTHVHHSSSMNQKHLLRFIKSKVRRCGDDKVLIDRSDPSGERVLTLTEVFTSLNLTTHELSVDTLDMHADNTTFHRFDRFNLKYSPAGQSRLREVFMKTDNLMGGRYLAEITHELFSDLRDTKYQHSEPRLSIYGRAPDEWAKLATWAVDHKIYSDNVRWLIQVPRLYSVYRKLGTVESFQTLLDNIFNPLFEATLDPQSHADIAHFLQQVVGFDSVDDESVPTPRLDLRRAPPPASWTSDADPPFEYQAYYLATNLSVLNRLRESRGLNTFTYRPHAGEAGEVDHLAACFLLAHGINHGINLRRAPVLQHLYYLTQIGVAMSPISNNALFLEYLRNPFIAFFRRGLNVSLSTDDPLQLAMTKEPLMEEFAVAAQVWKLTSTDLCELARNSVVQSGFEGCCKAHWIGERWWEPGAVAPEKTNVPQTRARYRYDTLADELSAVYGEVPTDVYCLPTHRARMSGGGGGGTAARAATGLRDRSQSSDGSSAGPSSSRGGSSSGKGASGASRGGGSSANGGEGRRGGRDGIVCEAVVDAGL
ncbi:hypothetical protein I4F81_006096 [Pyropia yezoensis]|uniref:Uncharacterized protein n=1 Tax=Pyropia yezoensis TaxID=2788 RepID=A0ACC3C1A6_PYRYE|nr:hypothetical protein I4F81_006096 [Neopyropia yezoensis]